MPATNADTSMTEETESLLTTVPLDIDNGGGGIARLKSARPSSPSADPASLMKCRVSVFRDGALTDT